MSLPVKDGRVLVIDDEDQIRRAVQSILSTRGYEVITAETGHKGLELVVERPPDLVILDLGLPDLDGMAVCAQLRAWMSAPILVLTVRDQETDIITALDGGADDYLTKPFWAGELLARVRALLRRAVHNGAGDPVIRVEGLEIDVARRRVIGGGREIHVTRTEFDILAFLARNPDRVVTSRTILREVWGPEYIEDFHTLRVHVFNLRRKIEPDPSVPRFVLTEPGVGYMFATA